DRGRVFQRAGDGTLTVPSPDGPITILVSALTRIDDGQPSPGADIRAEGTVAPGTRTIAATRVRVLCPGPAPVDPGDVPPGSVPAPINPPPPACRPVDFRCEEASDCCAGLSCKIDATGDGVCLQ